MRQYIIRTLGVIVLLQASFSLTAQSSMSTAIGYTIHGKLLGLQDHTAIYLVKSSDHRIGLDTLAMTYTKGDTFFFQGRIETSEEGVPFFIYIDTLDHRYLELKKKYLMLHMENKAIMISGSIKDMGPRDITIEGSGAQADLVSYLKDERKNWISEFVSDVTTPAIFKLYEQLSKDSTRMARDMITGASKLDSAIRENVAKKRTQYILDWIKAHPESLISPWLLSNERSPEAKSQWASIYAGFSDRVKESYFGLEFKKRMTRENNLTVGSMVPKLNLPTPQGELLSLHAIARRNKLTLVDFWAYWCAPCRASFPQLKKLYETYRYKGLAIYGVSIDTDTLKWRIALREERLPWDNVILQKASMAKDLFGVEFLPAVFLLDEKGRIITRWLGENKELEQILEQRLR